MKTIEVLGPGCEMVVALSHGKRYMAFRRADVKRLTDAINPTNSNAATLLEFYDHHDDLFIDMPFDSVLELLSYGTPYHTEPANASQRGD